ncbi:MAG TPA: S1 family peptidase [Solirubrobacteraceae bacterium]|nr:S1 family peptidase [Solirubrobacteraceae bacterium]
MESKLVNPRILICLACCACTALLAGSLATTASAAVTTKVPLGLQAQIEAPTALAEQKEMVLSAYERDQNATPARAQAVLALQAKAAGLQETLQARLGSGLDQAWLDTSGDTDQVVVDVAPGVDVQTVEEALTKSGLTAGDWRIVPKSWDDAQLSQERSRLTDELKPYIHTGEVKLGVGREAQLEILLAADASTPARTAAAAAASSSASPVKPLVQDSSEERFAVQPVWYESPGYGSPLIAGMYYDNYVVSCSTGFYATSPVNSEAYFLTAGHCAKPAEPQDKACKSSSSCSNFGSDIGGWLGPGGDYGLMIDTAKSTWPPYPAFIDWSCCSGTLPVYGASSPTVGEYVCHTGWRSEAVGVGTTCGTVERTESTIELEGSTVTEVEAGGSGLCVYKGDSGGPWFNPYNAYAIGIMSAAEIPSGEGECGRNAWFTSAPLAAADMGVSIAIY